MKTGDGDEREHFAPDGRRARRRRARPLHGRAEVRRRHADA